MNLPTTIMCADTLFTYYGTNDDDRVIYHGANHDDTTRETLELIRTAPKRSGADYGVRRGYIRLTEDVPVTNADGSTKVAPAVSTSSINWPVGVADPRAVVIKQLRKLLGAVSCGVHCDDSEPNYLLVSGTVTELYDEDSVNKNAQLASIAAFFEDGKL